MKRAGKWPKQLKQLTKKQKWIKDDFMYYWHEVLPKKYGLVEWFNHNYPVWKFQKYYPKKRKWDTLEIGGGRGSHIPFEKNFARQNYSVLELRENMLSDLHKKYPCVEGVIGDAQESFGENCYDRIIAIHVLEHLPDLPRCVKYMKQALRGGGVMHIVIPCEGSFAYTVCRKISAERIFKKRYHMPYGWYIRSEHVNTPHEIIEELEREFTIVSKSYFPAAVPFVFFNIVIGLELRPK